MNVFDLYAPVTQATAGLNCQLRSKYLVVYLDKVTNRMQPFDQTDNRLYDDNLDDIYDDKYGKAIDISQVFFLQGLARLA